MSSGIEGGGEIAAAVLIPVGLTVGAVIGAGWAAWQAGRLVVAAGQAVNREVAAEKQRIEAAAALRRRTAEAGREKLCELCKGLLAAMEGDGEAALGSLAEREEIRSALEQILAEPMPEDTARLESMNAASLAMVERLAARRHSLLTARVRKEGSFRGFAAADLMDDLRIVFASALIRETVGEDVAAAEPEVLERAKLDRRLHEVGARVITALEFVVSFAQSVGLRASSYTWFQTCFGGVEDLIAELCSPTVSTERLRRGIRSLEETMQLFDMMYPSFAREMELFPRLYEVYAKAAEVLGEQVRPADTFADSKEVEEELVRLEERAKRAQQCAEVYQRLGRDAYMCLAWDTELAALGYTVQKGRSLKALVGHGLPRAVQPGANGENDTKLPAYLWDDGSLTEIYEIAPGCYLQLIVHRDGTTTMQMILDSGDEAMIEIQRRHCASMELLHKRLAENWFITCDMRETAPAEAVYGTAAWRSSIPARGEGREDDRREQDTTKKQGRTIDG